MFQFTHKKMTKKTKLPSVTFLFLLQLDGKNVVSSGWDGKVVMWDIQSGKKVNELCWDNYVNTMAWLDAEKKTLVVGGKSGNLILVQFWTILPPNSKMDKIHFCIFRTQAVWPDAGIKSNPNFPNSCQIK